MPEFSDYVEGLTPAASAAGDELIPVSKDGESASLTPNQIVALAGGGGHVIEDEGTPLTQRTKLNFVGAGVTVTDDSGDDASVVTIPSAAAILTTTITNGDTTHAPDGNAVFDALALKQDLVNSATALVDAASMDLTAIKHTLATSSATRTFTISYTGDDITLEVTLSATSSTFTFPATSLCVSDGLSTGDNTLPLAGVSGDKYIIAIKKIGSAYYVVSKNFGQ